jgi:hypothetical protein
MEPKEPSADAKDFLTTDQLYRPSDLPRVRSPLTFGEKKTSRSQSNDVRRSERGSRRPRGYLGRS